jgi:hypothetical protein
LLIAFWTFILVHTPDTVSQVARTDLFYLFVCCTWSMIAFLVTCWHFLTVSVKSMSSCQFWPGISQQNGIFIFFLFSISINIVMSN